jgi:hypothetical protein
MPHIALAVAAQLLASDKFASELLAPADDRAVLVERDGTSSLSVWMPILADGSTPALSVSDLKRLAASTERVLANDTPTFVVDELRAGRPRALGHEGGIAGVGIEPGFDISISVFAASSIPPDLQQQLRDAVQAVETYFENTLSNAVIGPGGIPQDVTLRLALRVTALAANVPGASQVKPVAVPMSSVTRKLTNRVYGNDGDDYVPGVPTFVDSEGNPTGVSALRVRYSAASTASSGENRVFLTRAQCNALGFNANESGPTSLQFDGTILMNSGFQWDYDPSDGVSLNQVTRFSFQDYLVREVLIQLGWISGVDFLQRDLTLLDMFRFGSLASSLVAVTSDDGSPFTGEPINSLLGSAWLSNLILQGFYSSGNGSNDLPLDYNPGVSAAVIAAAQQIIDAGTFNVDPNHLANMVSNEVTCPLVPGEPPSPADALNLSLIYQLGGLEVAVPQPSSSSRPTLLDSRNRFDDGEWPAETFGGRTRYPDGAAPLLVAWPSEPRARWNFNAPSTLAAAGSGNIVAASTAFGGAQLGLFGGLTVADCDVDVFTTPPVRLLPLSFGATSDSEVADPFSNRCLRIVSGWGNGRGIEVRCSTAGAPAPSLYLDMRLAQEASSTWRFSYSLDNGATFSSADLPDNGLIRISTPDAFICGIRFDLLVPSFTPGPNTRFRLAAVPPPGSSLMQSVSQARGGTIPFSTTGAVEFDMVTVSPDVGAQLLVDFNQSFRGHMPRLVARGSKSHLNFGLTAEPKRAIADTELAVGSGNSFSNSRASFLVQTTVAIPAWERFLMGQSSTASTTTIPRGITYWTRDPAAYAAGPSSPAWRPLGSLPDFLSEQELLVLDQLGWDITGVPTTDYLPDPSIHPWETLVGEQLHTPHGAYDQTGPARP